MSLIASIKTLGGGFFRIIFPLPDFSERGRTRALVYSCTTDPSLFVQVGFPAISIRVVLGEERLKIDSRLRTSVA